jgi:hypothetical protein
MFEALATNSTLCLDAIRVERRAVTARRTLLAHEEGTQQMKRPLTIDDVETCGLDRVVIDFHGLSRHDRVIPRELAIRNAVALAVGVPSNGTLFRPSWDRLTLSPHFGGVLFCFLSQELPVH